MAVLLIDEQLMERLQQGQTDALDALYRRYAAKLYTFCRYTTRTLDAQGVEDLVQDVLCAFAGRRTLTERVGRPFAPGSFASRAIAA